MTWDFSHGPALSRSVPDCRLPDLNQHKRSVNGTAAPKGPVPAHRMTQPDTVSIVRAIALLPMMSSVSWDTYERAVGDWVDRGCLPATMSFWKA